MVLNDNQLVTLLLTTSLGISDKSVKPLSLGKWNKLVKKIVSSNLKEPGALLNLEANEIKEKLSLSQEETDQIYNLLKKGAYLAIQLEELNRRGIYTLCRSDKEYPNLIKKKLKEYAPAVIFYSGNLDILNRIGIGMVGSRKIDIDILDNTKFICEKAVNEGLTIISGGAKGVDSSSETAAFECGGEYISFICDSLVSRIKKKDVRDRISTGRALYMTMDGPNYPFSPARAMNRNKYIYSLSKATIIMNSDYNHGGTWAGAIENLKKDLSIPFVINNNSKGNIELIKLGCNSIELKSDFSIKKLCENIKTKNNSASVEKNEEIVQMNLFSGL
ncbi:DNA-processing protein DprA [Clostridium nigeriense]|uniref:DNA-processing protein DprA n=1 Tax=Clostridium nigeriense TaxID=1805470 RepID=UPI000837999D|nr:DNA-processing protein DprA [Clostridium nigeriense]